ncbi:hypothetical protein D1AOALGA4SA_6800 [Olavius algarvensis Delta 1 endosymbiont]|nr:hypothetical protein D1AOALGA4SA_6800 [Olavius algarvensis Delta 1 endosymbiont]
MWEWPPATITRSGEIAVRNRSHNPKQPIQNYKVFVRSNRPFVWPTVRRRLNT